ncbi:MAG: LL-diaminopimelate aminotransferase, partial [Muribaculaceae bacterium]|nr:LL-diaminopimelate aminotransferase [Muribaculaceae bacterium]
MFKVNNNYAELPESYLFSEVAHRLAAFREANPDREVIRMDIGDVSIPLGDVVVKALCKASEDMGTRTGFHGYGPEQGYLFLREKIARFDYKEHGIHTIGAEDIFVSDGAKSDLGNFVDMFGDDIRIAVTDPGYPVYVDTNVLSGRGGKLVDGKWSGLTYLECKPENGFKPQVPTDGVDVIYLCFPNNPTGVALNRSELKEWVDYAIEHGSLLIFDSAYEAYISSEDVPHSIYEIEEAEKVAVEIRSYSKTAGFTGVRCGYTVVPRALEFKSDSGNQISLNKMWNRRQSTKFNGVGYIVQKAAEALYTAEGREMIRENIAYYKKNAAMLREALEKKSWMVIGGIDSPYVWAFPESNGVYSEGASLTSWQLFDKLLSELNISSTPGVGFGECAEGWVRFTGFNTYENTLKAIE